MWDRKAPPPPAEGAPPRRGRGNIACCFTCGHGESCRVGGIHLFFGAGTKITEELTPRLDKQPEKLAEARELGRRLSQRLHERTAVT
ncbi:MAG: hypothetical protein WC789_05870 [Lentisphaeria bacterium]